MPALPIALLAFAAGATLLQWQPALPSITPWWRRRRRGRRRSRGRCAGSRDGARSRSCAGRAPLAHRRRAARRRGGRRARIRLRRMARADAPRGCAAAGMGGRRYRARRHHRRVAAVVAARHALRVRGRADRNASVPWCLRDSRSRGIAQIRKDGTSEPPPPLSAGERWRLVVRLKRPHGTVNPHGFDIEAWLLENNLRATGYVRNDERNARLDAFAGRPSDWVERARERMRARILAALPDAEYAGVIVALTIGDQRAIPEPQWRDLQPHRHHASDQHFRTSRHRVRGAGRGARLRRSRGAARGSRRAFPRASWRRWSVSSRPRPTCCWPARRCPRSGRC